MCKVLNSFSPTWFCHFSQEYILPVCKEFLRRYLVPLIPFFMRPSAIIGASFMDLGLYISKTLSVRRRLGCAYFRRQVWSR